MPTNVGTLLVYLFLLWLILLAFAKFCEFSGHCGIVFSEFLNADVLCLIVRKAKVTLGTDEGLFDLLKVVNSLVDLLDRGAELLACKFVILAELVLEVKQAFFKISDIYVLVFDHGKFLLVSKRVTCGISQNRDKRNEELRANYVHLFIQLHAKIF